MKLAGAALWVVVALLVTPKLFFAAARAAQTSPEQQQGFSDEPITPIPLPVDLDPKKVDLGEKLFNEPFLSKTKRVACTTCHQLGQGGDDGVPHSIAPNGAPETYNTSTVFNCSLDFWLTWRGEFRSLEALAAADLASPHFDGAGWETLLPKLRADPGYAAAFGSLYRDGVTQNNFIDALSTFQRSLVTPNARFDKYLRGEADALTAEEKQGYEAFKSYGCAACHQGVNIGGNMFAKIGIFADYFVRRKPTESDLGRYSITHREQDKYVFRVPSLRNIALTAPYFHDGSVASLEDAVRIMARTELGRPITADDVALIVKFLHTLTGEYRGRSLTP